MDALTSLAQTTLALLSGPSAVGESLNYLVDVPMDARGRPERLKDREMLLFADLVPSRPGAIQLTGRNAQLDYSPELEARVRPVLAALLARDKPPVVSAIIPPIETSIATAIR